MGFAQMRRQDRMLPPERARELLQQAKWGVLAFAPDEMGYPHAVPINCAYVDGALLFHGAKQGKKMDLIARDPRACFTAVLRERLVPERDTTEYASVVCYGTLELVPEDGALDALAAFEAAVFCMDLAAAREHVAAAAPKTQLIRMRIDHMTAKANGPQ